MTVIDYINEGVSLGPARVGESLLREIVTSGPPLVRSGHRSTRWHLIRSAEDYLSEYDGEIRRRIMSWCGQVISRLHITAGDLPDDEPLCGTCYGRREGWKQEGGLLFTPRLNSTTPKVCPGSRRNDFSVHIEGPLSWCLACTQIVRAGRIGSPCNPDWGLRSHEPGEGLIPPCPWHGWRDLVRATDADGRPVVACRCMTIEKAS